MNRLVVLFALTLVPLVAGCDKRPGGDLPKWTVDPLECEVDADCVTTPGAPMGLSRCCQICGPSVIAAKHAAAHLEACEGFNHDLCPVPGCVPPVPERPACVDGQCRFVEVVEAEPDAGTESLKPDAGRASGVTATPDAAEASQ